jgi:hypothetical protein
VKRRFDAALGFALFFAACQAALSLSVLALGYPHEDAYILFKFARHVALGQGSVFYPGGPHAEGATDFLWMMLLAALRGGGIDPAIGALLLDACGYGLVIHRLVRLLERTGAPSGIVYFLTSLGGALLLLHPLSVAGALGFSATLYAALALELYAMLLEERTRGVPALSLVLGLMRPDGVLLGGAATLLTLFRARQRGRARAAALEATVCAVIGAGYFALRARYFGELLPLPLIVKSHYMGRPPGVAEGLDWASSTLVPMLGAIAAIRWVFGPNESLRPRAWIPLVPFAIHVLGFVPSFPSQNVANRFQAPATLVLFAFALSAAARGLAAARAGRTRVRFAAGVGVVTLLVFAITYPQGVIGVRALRESYEPDYVNPFAVELAMISGARAKQSGAPLRIASTEAGRILYWTEGPVIDLVGLDTRETAYAPPSRAFLRAFDPDVVMFHHASGLNEDGLEHGRKGDVLSIEPPLAQYVVPWNREYLRADLPPYAELRVDNVRVAPIATAAYLDERSDEYELWAARFDARFARLHIYAIRKGLPEKDAIVRALERAHDPAQNGSHLSALRMTRE